MNFKIKTTTLLNGLNKVSSVVDSKNSIEGLTGIYLKATDQSLTIIGSDSSMTMKCIIDTDIEIFSEGSIIVPQLFTSFVAKIDDEFIEFSVLENNVSQIKTKKSDFKLNGLDASAFPVIDFSLNGDKLTLKTDEFKKLINETIHAANLDELRPMLSGVNLTCNDHSLTMAATNSFRLALSSLDIDSDLECNIILTTKSLKEFVKVASDETFDLYISNQKVIFDLGNITILSSLISGNYPNVVSLIPVHFTTKVNFSKKELYKSLDIANLLSIKNNFIVTLKNEDKDIILYTRTQDSGSGDEQVDYISHEGEDIHISFNSKYVIDALRVLDAENVTINFTDNMGPFIITSTEDNNKSIQLVLPVKTYYN